MEPSGHKRLLLFAYAVLVLARMRDRTGGPRARYRLLALLIALGMLISAAPLLIPIISGIVDGLNG